MPRREFGAALLEIEQIAALRLEGDIAVSGGSRLLRGRLLELQRLAAPGGSERAAAGGRRRRLDRERRDRRRRRGARSRGPSAGRDRGRRSCGQTDPAGLHRHAYPLSADARDRLLWRAAAGLAAKIHVRRRAEVFRSAAMPTTSRGSFSTSCSARGRRRRWSIARSVRNRSTLSSPRASAAARG